MANFERERVVLLHGLAESPLTMAPLELALRKRGYCVSNIFYPSTVKSAEELAGQCVAPLLTSFNTAPKLHFVTHPLGRVLLHACLGKFRPKNLGRVVMTAPGLHGSEALEGYRGAWLFRMMFGPAAFQSGTGDDPFAQVLEQNANYELGVIATDPIAIAQTIHSCVRDNSPILPGPRTFVPT